MLPIEIEICFMYTVKPNDAQNPMKPTGLGFQKRLLNPTFSYSGSISCQVIYV